MNIEDIMLTKSKNIFVICMEKNYQGSTKPNSKAARVYGFCMRLWNNAYEMKPVKTTNQPEATLFTTILTKT